MTPEAGLARLAAALGSPSRSRMIAALMRGTARSATDLALDAGVTPQTASKHLARLQEAGVVRVKSRGRFRLYEVADARTAHCIESMMVLSADGSQADERLRWARTCYDHLAGRLGVAITESLLERGCLRAADERFVLTAAGADHLGRLGMPVEWIARGARSHARCCLDWSERRPHVGGIVGAALARLSLTRVWVRRYPDDRALEVTSEGRTQLARWFDVRLESLR